jgi:hypothetical protein
MNEVLIAVCILAAVTASRFLGRQFAKRVIHPVTKDMKADIARMVAEFSPNGGSSMRDKVDAISQKADLAATVSAVAAKEATAARKRAEEIAKYEHTRWHDLGNFLQAELGAKYRAPNMPALFKDYEE